ncbi:hypothetical protein [Fonticella tunisiensis]|uniref:Uncharacterized protein n=1 Tax=Fonticella tunisiensis TaxID=1096341 RepID=A0A4R7KSX8_9CLOT|nr:hypothetical protein [Fonticella tunisiensis]TDT62868.1 hypothetical protein EDD71_103145 [Fonticella tunisiensis]
MKINELSYGIKQFEKVQKEVDNGVKDVDVKIPGPEVQPLLENSIVYEILRDRNREA